LLEAGDDRKQNVTDAHKTAGAGGKSMGFEPRKEAGASTEPTEEPTGSEPKKEVGAPAPTKSAKGELVGSEPEKEARAPRSPRRGSRARKANPKVSGPDWM
jgi:hypothetical protein